MHPTKRLWYLVNRNTTPLDAYTWLGNTSHRIPFRPHTKKSRKKRRRYKFWEPLSVPFSPPPSNKIHNLSTYNLNKLETKLLNLGLKFIPPSAPPTSTSILLEFQNLSRSLRLRHFFRDDDSTTPQNPFKLPNPSWNPPTKYPPLEKILHKHLNLLTNKLQNTNLPTRNTPLHLLQALKSLRRNKQIIILPADKNVGVCVLDKQTYLDINCLTKGINIFLTLCMGSMWVHQRNVLHDILSVQLAVKHIDHEIVTFPLNLYKVVYDPDWSYLVQHTKVGFWFSHLLSAMQSLLPKNLLIYSSF